MNQIAEQWLILISLPIYIIVIGLEIFLSHLHQKQTYTFKNTIANIYLMLLNSGIDLLFRLFYFVALDFFFAHAFFSIENKIAYWVILLLAQDFLYYWLHRFDHEIRFFWATHVTHHSSEKMNLTVGFRSSVFQPLYRFIYFIPLSLCCFKTIDIAVVYSATQIWGILVHTEYKISLGWFENIFVSPSHHRVHHASNAKYLDKNMGMFLIVWDKMFGTFQRELSEQEYQPIKYGLTQNLNNPNAINLVFDEWKNITNDVNKTNITLKQKLLYIFGKPGYSHDGSRMTSKELLEKELEK